MKAPFSDKAKKVLESKEGKKFIEEKRMKGETLSGVVHVGGKKYTIRAKPTV